MPRRFFRKFALNRHELRKRWFLAPFRQMLQDPRLWSMRRQNVLPAFALGLFVGCQPLPLHVAGSAVASLLLRINLPVAVLATLVSNPLTMAPLYYFNYRVGMLLLPGRTAPFRFEPSLEWLTTTFLTLWQPLLLGSVLVGAVLALSGYAILALLWRLSLVRYKVRKRRRRTEN